MLEAKDLSFTYSRRPVLRNVSFAVGQGEVLAVAGANGAGKTTLLRVLATLAVPDSGKVTFDGTDIFAKSLKYRRQLGYLSDSAALYEDMTAGEYLNYRARLKGEPRKRIRRRVGEAVEMCRIGESVDVPIRLLSAGFRRKVALADALLLRPRVLLLDDFLAGLDASMRLSCGEILSAVAQFSSVVITGHELETIVGLSTRVLILKDGASQIVEKSKAEPVADTCARIVGIIGGKGGA
jgi:ABC-2 type transport system ATP-binding protein